MKLDLETVELEGLEPTALREMFRFGVEQPPEVGRRVTIYKPPVAGHRYSVGVDWALGLTGRDKDALCVIDADTIPPEQVAQIEGYWGERFDRVVYAICRYYGSAFLVGEANMVGLGRLQRIFFDYKWRWVYYENRGGGKSKKRKKSDQFGVYRSQPAQLDPIISAYRRVVIDKAIVLRDEHLVKQMADLQWAVRSASVEHDSATDSDMIMKLSTGGSPDLVISGAMSYWGVLKMDLFKEPERDDEQFDEGTLGNILDHAEVFADDDDDEDDGGGKGQLPSQRRRRGSGGRSRR